MLSDREMLTFKAIMDFVNDINDIFGSKQKSLLLYQRLIGHTKMIHVDSIKRHIESFRLFCVSNRESFESRDYKQFVTTKISYSEKVCIDMTNVFVMAEELSDSSEIIDAIWRHLLTISTIVDTSGNASKILKSMNTEIVGYSKHQSHSNQSNTRRNDVKNMINEDEFLSDIMKKVEGSIDPNKNPMESIGDILKSGIFTELMEKIGNGVNDGSLDMNKMMGSVQNLMSNVKGGDKQMDMFNTMLSSASQQSDGELDMSSMMGPLMTMMTQQNNNIEQ
jgi:hypothetical protein